MSLDRGENQLSDVTGMFLRRRTILFPPDVELFPGRRRQLEKIAEEGETLGSRWQLVGGIIPNGSDCVYRCEDSTESEQKTRRLGCEVDGHGGGRQEGRDVAFAPPGQRPPFTFWLCRTTVHLHQMRANRRQKPQHRSTVNQTVPEVDNL